MADQYRRVQGADDGYSGDCVEKFVDVGSHHAKEVYVASIATKAASTGHVHEPAANTAAVVTLAAGGAGVSNALGMIAWSYDADPTGGELKIEDGAGSTVFKARTGRNPEPLTAPRSLNTTP